MGDLFGGGGGGDTSVQTVTPSIPAIPNQNELNSIAQHRIFAGSPWTYSPYRAIDFVQNVAATPSYAPQYNPQQGMPSYPVGMGSYMGNWSTPTGGFAQPNQYVGPQQQMMGGGGGVPNLQQLLGFLGGLQTYLGSMQPQQQQTTQQQQAPQQQTEQGGTK